MRKHDEDYADYDDNNNYNNKRVIIDVTYPELSELQTVTRSLLVTSEGSNALR